MVNQRGFQHLPIILALFFGAAVTVTIFGYMLWPKDEEIGLNDAVRTLPTVEDNVAPAPVDEITAAACGSGVLVCQDGTVVTRALPTCEFPSCPAGTEPTAEQPVVDPEPPTNTNTSTESEDQEESVIKGPIKKVTNITTLFPNAPDEGFRRVNIMGDKALIAGGKYLYLYDSKTESVTDLSDQFRSSDPSVESRILVPGGIANNDKYWILGNTRVGETIHLYTFDGKTWNDLTEELLSAVPNSITGGLNFSWNGSYWLIGHNPGHLVKYDGQTFTDLYSQIPNPEGNVTFMDIDWNGSFFMFVMLGPGNHGRAYRYDGTTFTRVTEVSDESYVTTLGWNGAYWLISGFNGQHMLKYDGKKLVDTGVGTRHQAMTAWVKSHWLISGQLFDGETLDPMLTVLGGFDISVGKNFGIALNYQSVQRFDF